MFLLLSRQVVWMKIDSNRDFVKCGVLMNRKQIAPRANSYNSEQPVRQFTIFTQLAKTTNFVTPNPKSQNGTTTSAAERKKPASTYPFVNLDLPEVYVPVIRQFLNKGQGLEKLSAKLRMI